MSTFLTSEYTTHQPHPKPNPQTPTPNSRVRKSLVYSQIIIARKIIVVISTWNQVLFAHKPWLRYFLAVTYWLKLEEVVQSRDVVYCRSLRTELYQLSGLRAYLRTCRQMTYTYSSVPNYKPSPELYEYHPKISAYIIQSHSLTVSHSVTDCSY